MTQIINEEKLLSRQKELQYQLDQHTNTTHQATMNMHRIQGSLMEVNNNLQLIQNARKSNITNASTETQSPIMAEDK